MSPVGSITVVDSSAGVADRIKSELSGTSPVRIATASQVRKLAETGEVPLLLIHARHLSEAPLACPTVAYVTDLCDYPSLLPVRSLDRILLTEDTFACLPELVATWASYLSQTSVTPRLSPREREVAGLLVAGLSNKAIAAQLSLSNRTIEKHRSRAMAKIGARCVADLVRIVLDDSGFLLVTRQ